MSDKQEALSEEEFRNIKTRTWQLDETDFEIVGKLLAEINRLREELKERDREIIDNGTIAYWRVTRDFAINENAELIEKLEKALEEAKRL